MIGIRIVNPLLLLTVFVIGDIITVYWLGLWSHYATLTNGPLILVLWVCSAASPYWRTCENCRCNQSKK